MWSYVFIKNSLPNKTLVNNKHCVFTSNEISYLNHTVLLRTHLNKQYVIVYIILILYPYHFTEMQLTFEAKVFVANHNIKITKLMVRGPRKYKKFKRNS